MFLLCNTRHFLSFVVWKVLRLGPCRQMEWDAKSTNSWSKGTPQFKPVVACFCSVLCPMLYVLLPGTSGKGCIFYGDVLCFECACLLRVLTCRHDHLHMPPHGSSWSSRSDMRTFACLSVRTLRRHVEAHGQLIMFDCEGS